MPSKADKKARRRAAAAQEQSRRFRQTEDRSPLTRQQLDSLHDYLAQQIIANGHDGTFSITQRWLQDNQAPIDEALAFFQSCRLPDDFELAINGDSHKLFGPTDDRIARMPLQRGQLQSLIDWLAKQVPLHGCDHTCKLTRSWLTDHGHLVAETEMALLAQGGGCDCEVVYNVDPDMIYRSQ